MWALLLFLSGLSAGEHVPCPRLSVQEVGFNYVHFKGDLHRVRAIELAKSPSSPSLLLNPSHRGWMGRRGSRGGSILGKPLFYKFRRELPGRGIFPRSPGIVPLLRSQGFRVGAAPGREEGRKGGREAGLGDGPVVPDLRDVCSAPRASLGGLRGVHRRPLLPLRLRQGPRPPPQPHHRQGPRQGEFPHPGTSRQPKVVRVTLQDSWNSLGVMVSWRAGEWGPLAASVEASVTWDPYDCDALSGSGDPGLCSRPFVAKSEPIDDPRGSETFIVDKARANLVTLVYDVLLDFRPLRKAYPDFRIPPSYVFHRFRPSFLPSSPTPPSGLLEGAPSSSGGPSTGSSPGAPSPSPSRATSAPSPRWRPRAAA